MANTAFLIALAVLAYAFYVHYTRRQVDPSLKQYAPEQYDRAVRAAEELDDFVFAKNMYDLKMRLPNDMDLEAQVQELIDQRFDRDRAYVPAS